MRITRRPFRLHAAVFTLMCGLALPPSICPDVPLGWTAGRREEVRRSPLPEELDRDRDGLRDSEEVELARRFAPVVTLHADDVARPASVRWLLGRVGALASKAGLYQLGGFQSAVRRGSPRRSDWVTYVHVYPAAQHGGVLVQYWFFYPYNNGPWFLGHEGDWEHITVELDGQRRPIGVWAARHRDNAPGRFRAWARLRTLDGTHPEILSARGTHASYFDLDDVPWYDSAGRCADLAGRGCRHLQWRTWEGGGLQPMGERQAGQDAPTMSNAGRWGSDSLMPGCAAPHGPAYQRGWCSLGAPSCGMYGAY